MSLTSIGDQKTPGRPIEITFEANTGLPSSNQTVCLIGHLAASGGASGISLPYKSVTINNVSDVTAASGEVATKFGAGSELAKMVLATIQANAAIGASTFPALIAVGLNPADTDFGTADAALTALNKVTADYIVSPYAGSSASLRTKLKNQVATMSGAQRVENQQFGSFGVVAERATVDPSLLDVVDTQYIIGVYFRDAGTGPDAPTQLIGEVAAAAAGVLGGNIAPFNPLDSQTVGGLLAPLDPTQNITVGAGLESETALGKGWTPLFVKPNAEVAFVRTVTTRLTSDGLTPVGDAYIDSQDFSVLYLWRKTLWTRFSQPDFKKRKASAQAAQDILSECIRLGVAFQDQGMFQAMDKFAKEFKVERSATDRSRFDVKTPINVVPGLHVIATNVSASTRFDVITI